MMRATTVALILISVPAWARGDGWALDKIHVPNEARAAVCAPGSSFSIYAHEQGTISIVGGASYELEIDWTEHERHFTGIAQLPNVVLPGMYAIQLENEHGVDTNLNSVFVRDEIPETYIAVHITDLDIGGTTNGRPAIEVAMEIAQAIKESPVDLVIITGGVTFRDEPSEWRAALEFIHATEKPTIVCSAWGHIATLGPTPFVATFGEDRFLGIGSETAAASSGDAYAVGAAARLRDEMKTGRWNIGLIHYYGMRLHPRMHMSLFVDDPLDFLFCGYYRRENRAREKRVTWGSTPLLMTPAAADGAIRFIRIGPRGIEPDDVRYVVKTE